MVHGVHTSWLGSGSISGSLLHLLVAVRGSKVHYAIGLSYLLSCVLDHTSYDFNKFNICLMVFRNLLVKSLYSKLQAHGGCAYHVLFIFCHSRDGEFNRQ